MSEEPKYKIEILLNSAGYKGRDLDELLPEFITERDSQIGLFWQSSANGPESWIIVIGIVAIFSKVTDVFLDKLFEDLYEYSKSKLKKFFNKRPNNYGSIFVEFNDFKISCYGYYVPSDKFLDFFSEIPNLVKFLDSEKGYEWFVKYDEKLNEWKISPDR
jgi:hypothetical protein